MSDWLYCVQHGRYYPTTGSDECPKCPRRPWIVYEGPGAAQDEPDFMYPNPED